MQAKRINTKVGSILLLYTKNIPQLQRQTLPRVKCWEKIFQSKGPKRKAHVAILISNKTYFKLKSIRRDGEGQFILIKGTIHQNEVSILNIYATMQEDPHM